MATPTPPKSTSGGGSTAAASTQASTGTQTALEFVSQLENDVAAFKRELRGYGDANTVGRDTKRTREYLDRIHRGELQVAQSMGIDWQPNLSEFQGGSAGR